MSRPAAPLCEGRFSLPSGGGDAHINVTGLAQRDGATLAVYASQPVSLAWVMSNVDPEPCTFTAAPAQLFDNLPVPEFARYLRITCPGATPSTVYVASRSWPGPDPR